MANLDVDDDPGPPAEGCAIDLVDASGALTSEQVAWVRRRAVAAVGVLGTAGEVRVRLVGDDEMSGAHVRHMGIEGPTDVLTFDLSEGGGLDVDLLVCVPEAARRAAELGHPTEREVLLYIVHGVLHCLGHDDHDEAAAAAMHRREDEVLTAIGVGPVFDPRGGARP